MMDLVRAVLHTISKVYRARLLQCSACSTIPLVVVVVAVGEGSLVVQTSAGTPPAPEMGIIRRKLRGHHQTTNMWVITAPPWGHPELARPTPHHPIRSHFPCLRHRLKQ
jgi:hypothetical protein